MDLNSSCWVEVRPLVTSELEPANFMPILDVLYNFGQAFRFVVVDTVEDDVDEHRLVRFFLQFHDEQMQKQISNVIRTFLDVELVEASSPLEGSYGVCVDLELAKNYALPIVNCFDKEPVNLVDRLVACLAGSGTCVEVTAKADPNAVLNVQKFVYEKTSRTHSISRTVVDQGIGFVGETVGQDPKNATVKAGFGRTVDPWIRECTRHAQTKLVSKLFTCNIIIKSGTLQQSLAVKNALPSNMNRLKVFKHTNKPHTTTTKLKAPSRYFWRNNVLCRLWWILPLCIVLFAGLLGIFNPTKLFTATVNTNIILLISVFILSVGLFIAFKKRQPIVLSTSELAQLIGLPSAVAKLPIALGKVPLSRMQLAHQQQTQEQNKNLLDNNKKTSNPTQNGTPNSYRFPAVFEDEEP